MPAKSKTKKPTKTKTPNMKVTVESLIAVLLGMKKLGLSKHMFRMESLRNRVVINKTASEEEIKALSAVLTLLQVHGVLPPDLTVEQWKSNTFDALLRRWEISNALNEAQIQLVHQRIRKSLPQAQRSDRKVTQSAERLRSVWKSVKLGVAQKGTFNYEAPASVVESKPHIDLSAKSSKSGSVEIVKVETTKTKSSLKSSKSKSSKKKKPYV